MEGPSHSCASSSPFSSTSFASRYPTRNALVVENLFLRKQLAFYQERKRKIHRTNAATRFTMALLSRLFDWKSALVVVQPETLIRWQRTAVRLYWRWKSRPGRPKLPAEIRDFIRMASRDNPTWGEERIRNEIRVKFGLRVFSPDGRQVHDPEGPSAG